MTRTFTGQTEPTDLPWLLKAGALLPQMWVKPGICSAFDVKASGSWYCWVFGVNCN